MARRTLAWALVTPVSAAGILAAHALAYALTGTEPGAMHGYLAHAPQIVTVLATIGLVGLALQERGVGPRSFAFFALLAPLGFACQEHLERLAHTGEVPWLLTTPSFLVGLALQLPVAFLCVAVARGVVGSLKRFRIARPGRIGGAWLPLSGKPVARPNVVRLTRRTGRGPPLVLVS